MLQVASSPSLVLPASPSLHLAMSSSASGQDNLSTNQPEPTSSSKTMLAPVRTHTSISVASKSVHPYASSATQHRRKQPSSSHQPFVQQTEQWASSSAQHSSQPHPRETLYSTTPDHHQPPPLSDDSLTLDASNNVYSDFSSTDFGAVLEQEHKHQPSSSTSHPVSAADSSDLISSAPLNPQEIPSASSLHDNPLSAEHQSISPPIPSPPKSSKSTRAKGRAATGPSDSTSHMATRYSSSGPREGGGRSSQPKSSRKQFSACGACQLRQLSDLLHSSSAATRLFLLPLQVSQFSKIFH